MAYTDLILNQGTDFTYSLGLKSANGAGINLSGYIFKSQMKSSYYNANANANLVIQITDAANGVAFLTLDSANTSNLIPGRYVYDVKMVDSGGSTSRLLEGIITVTPQVTQ